MLIQIVLSDSLIVIRPASSVTQTDRPRCFVLTRFGGRRCPPRWIEGFGSMVTDPTDRSFGLVQTHSRDLSTANSHPGADGSKPCSINQRAATKLRSDHHARITSRSTSVP
jgi:hypothetical protein